MAKIKLTVDQVVELAKTVVSEYGSMYYYQDHHDMSLRGSWVEADEMHGSACRYEFQGASCCLVGKVLEKAGLTTEELRMMDRVEGTSTLIAHNYVAQNLVELPDEGWNFLRNLQDSQDAGSPWGMALDDAVADL